MSPSPQVVQEAVERYNKLWVKLHTSFKPAYSCAICGVSIDGMSPIELDTVLFNN
ncbi:MAG: hypothetical protein NVSMB63_14650 [Sediminibacterium sp.]